MDFSFRAPRVIAALGQFLPLSKPNIICLNEVDNYKHYYRPNLESLGYETVVIWRKKNDATLIGWDYREFNLLR